MEKLKLCLLLFFFSVLLSGCRPPKETATKTMVGINGEATYILNDDGSISGVVKPEYDTEDYAIIIWRDTVLLGEEFRASLLVIDSAYRITIENPTTATIESGNGFKGSKSYSFTPLTTGEYQFSGTVEWDSLSVPFTYKFLVIEKR